MCLGGGHVQRNIGMIRNYIRANAGAKDSVTMAIELGISGTTLWKIAREMKISLRASQFNRANDKEMLRRVEFVKEHCQGLTITEIAKKLQISYGTVYGMCKDYSIPICLGRLPRKPKVMVEAKEGFFDADAFFKSMFP